jgi:hypothetical protein
MPRAEPSRGSRLIPTGSANSATLTTSENTMYPMQWVALHLPGGIASGEIA